MLSGFLNFEMFVMSLMFSALRLIFVASLA